MDHFNKTRRLVAIALLGVASLAAAACGSAADDSTTSDSSTDATVDSGFGAKDASADVKLVNVAPDSIGFATAKLEVTNNSSKRSNYYVEANIVNQSDDSVVTFTNATVNNLEPGAVAKVDMVPVEWMSTYKVVITEVQRTAA